MAARGSASAENYFKNDFSWISMPPSGYPPGIMEKAKWTFRGSQHCALCQGEIPLDKVASGYTGHFLLVWYIV
jgi:hypothetical protein